MKLPLSAIVVIKNNDKILIHLKNVQSDPGWVEQKGLLESKRMKGVIENGETNITRSDRTASV